MFWNPLPTRYQLAQYSSPSWEANSRPANQNISRHLRNPASHHHPHKNSPPASRPHPPPLFLKTHFNIILSRSRGSSVGTVSGCVRTGRPGFYPRQRQRIFPLTSASRPALGPTQPPVQWVPGALSPGVKRGQGVMLTTHPLLVPRVRKSRSCTSCHPDAPLWSVTGPLYFFYPFVYDYRIMLSLLFMFTDKTFM
jgi:hypothetical protein